MLDDATKERIEQDIASEDVVLYMNCLLYTSDAADE